MKKDITELFVFIDDFCKVADEYLSAHMIGENRKPTRKTELTKAEILTIILMFQQSPCKNFKYFYQSYLQAYNGKEFRSLCSYNRFIELKQRVTIYLALLLEWLCKKAKQTGVSFIDSSMIPVCHNKRISSNKVFKSMAAIGKGSMGFSFGFKLHIVINDKGEIQGISFTRANVDDRKVVPQITQKLSGLLFGDKGYISQTLCQKLLNNGLKLITNVKKNMKNQFMTVYEKTLLRKRSLVETIFDILKNKLEIVHTRHRSIHNFFIHLLSTLVAYSLKKKKPSVILNNLIPN